MLLCRWMTWLMLKPLAAELCVRWILLHGGVLDRYNERHMITRSSREDCATCRYQVWHRLCTAGGTRWRADSNLGPIRGADGHFRKDSGEFT